MPNGVGCSDFFRHFTTWNQYALSSSHSIHPAIFKMLSGPLPIRMAHPSRSDLGFFTDDYFRFLKSCGYEGLYLQDSPFDPLRTGNAGNFKRHYHLIYLYDLAYGHRRDEYVEYVHEICRRAAQHDLAVHLCLWEPRLPEYVRSTLPLVWHGTGGFAHHGFKRIALCWGVPEAVQYWKEMARLALDAVPGIRGIHLGMVDNEASFCDSSCPRCGGKSRETGMLEVYRCLGEIAQGRKDFRMAVYDWWFPPDVLTKLPDLLPQNSLLIGRSAQGFRQVIDGKELPGQVEDMTCIMDDVSPATLEQVHRAKALGFRFVDMVAWSHPNETWWLPAGPDPLFAIRKLNALQAAGAEGFYDFDCGAIEPGSVAHALRAWTENPLAPEEALVVRVLEEIWGEEASAVQRAYDLFREAKVLFPIALEVAEPRGFSGRSVGLGVTLVAPFHLTDLRFQDTGHRFNWFAPFNLLTAETLPILLPLLRRMVPLLRDAWTIAQQAEVSSDDAIRERESFEIHFRHSLSILHYTELAEAKWNWVEGLMPAEDYLRHVRDLAQTEMENTEAVARWLKRNLHGISNPCHQLHGWLAEMWPDLDFSTDLLKPKMISLAHLASLQATTPVPDYAIHAS